jgi:hypothetical protein
MRASDSGDKAHDLSAAPRDQNRLIAIGADRIEMMDHGRRAADRIDRIDEKKIRLASERVDERDQIRHVGCARHHDRGIGSFDKGS